MRAEKSERHVRASKARGSASRIVNAQEREAFADRTLRGMVRGTLPAELVTWQGEERATKSFPPTTRADGKAPGVRTQSPQVFFFPQLAAI
mgnify:CR=1 FL=1